MRCTHNSSRRTRFVEVLCRSFLMHASTTIARALAAAFLRDDCDVDEFVKRGGKLLGKRWRWLRPLAKRILAAHSPATRPRQIVITRFILADAGFSRACRKHELHLVHVPNTGARMRPISAASSWSVPRIESVIELAQWLELNRGELAWFADLRSLEARQNQGRLRHYRYRPLAKRFGQVRLIEAPKPRLKHLQRRILTEILEQIPPHDAAHGFRAGRSIKTFAAPHVGRHVVLKIDLRDFFPSVTIARVQAMFRSVGYPEEVANLLAGLCTNTAPHSVWPREPVGAGPALRQARWRYAQPHLPQGSPASPALANLTAYRLDCRLTGLARAAGATYTRYADDLAFSGERDFARIVQRFQHHVGATVLEEGFAVHHRKTRIMRQGVPQRIAGVIVNTRLNVHRAEFDRLKATLTNCIRHGATSQNRQQHPDFRRHLEGQISFVQMLNPGKGQRLRALFDRIAW